MATAVEADPEASGAGERFGRDGRSDRLAGVREQYERARNLVAGPGRWRQLARDFLLALVFIVIIEWWFGTSPADLINGISLGALYGIIAVAVILIYRTARIINFAAGAIGAVPAIVGLLLDVSKHVSYLYCLPVAAVGGVLAGVLTDLLVMRRFAKVPRLIATVITTGVAYSWAVPAFFLPIWFGQKNAAEVSLVPTPWQKWVIHNGRGQPLLKGDEVAALIVVIALTAALGAFLKYTRMGIALRAQAENADRASLLGIPVKRVATVAWGIAGLLSAMAIFFSAPLIGVPSDATLGFQTLLYALAAAVVARMDRLGLALGAGIGVGVLIFSTIATTGDNSTAEGLMVVVIILALLFQRRGFARALDAGEGTWQTVKMFRPVPTELRNLPQVAAGRGIILGLWAAVMIALPFVIGASNLPYLLLLPLYGIVAVSLVILTGWAGQISLGQFGLVGLAAEVAGGLVANHNIDFFLAIAIGIGVGAVAAVVIGLPAVRIQGLYLAVTTLAFGFAVQFYLMNSHYWFGRHLMPSGLAAHVTLPNIYGRIRLSDQLGAPNKTFYFVCLVVLALCMVAALSFRRLRGGRVLIAVRDNQRAATAYTINLARTRLAAFAISGGICGVAGVLFVYAQRNVVPGTFDYFYGSLAVFLATAIAGMSSLGFAVLGAMTLEASVAFGPRLYDLLGPTWSAVLPLLLVGPVLILSLYQFPGGTAEWAYGIRDNWLRRLASRNNILVPSLVADRRVEAQLDTDVIRRAESRVEEVEAVGAGQ
ncbi:MAG TPA: ABC transporter permease [Acidimicrobiales bacterium]|nr:ABC transporter permease [Acidimicrobiales bacterium]